MPGAADRDALILLARSPDADRLRQVLFRKGQAHDYVGQYDSVKAHADQLAAFDDAFAQAHGALLAGRVHLRKLQALTDESPGAMHRRRATTRRM